MFSFDWVVLKKNQIKDNKSIISIFSKEYWKISAWNTESKSRLSVDIWNIYNFNIKTENKINKIENFKVKKIINTSNLGYKEINNILLISSILEKTIPHSLVIESIFEDYLDILESLEIKEDNSKIYLFFILRLIKKLWIYKSPIKWKHSDNFIRIFSIIDIYRIDSIMKIEWITKENLEYIGIFNTETLDTYIN